MTARQHDLQPSVATTGSSSALVPLMIATLLAVLSGNDRAEAAATAWSGDSRAQVRLITAVDGIDGKTIAAGLEFHYAEGWHGYWRTPGDAGIAPVIDWSASTNVRQTSIAWPAPSRLVVSGLQNSVYEGTFVLPVSIDLKDPRANVTLAAAVDYAACAKICVPVHADLALVLPAGASHASAEAAALAQAQLHVPGPPASAGIDIVRSTIEQAGASTTLVVEAHSDTEPFRAPDLFIEGAGDGLPPAPTVAIADGGMRAILTARLPGGQPAGPLTLTLVDGNRAAEFAMPARAVAPPSERTPRHWLPILASALLGGLILNLMPCVLPILSIKLLSLVRHAGAERKAARLGFIATALGIIMCFLALAAVLVVLKLSGATIGWGIQFQQPWFLAAMAVLTVLFAASFFEWLPIGLPQIFVRFSGATSRVALVEAFLAGVFSTLLATPCSAPFVGTAVGFALAQGPKEIVAVFLSLGLGMAAPFLGAACFPGVVAWLPRPGAWMLRLRHGLGVLLLGTAGWLLIVLGSVAGLATAIATTLALSLLLGLRFWTTVRPAQDRRWSRAATLGLAGIAMATAFIPVAGGARVMNDRGGWQAFDPEALDRAVAEGRTVLVDVTATWCLTCKVNDLTALETEPVRARLARPDTLRMRADWSRPNPAIAAYLKQFDRFGIPLDVVYGPSSTKGEPLPELLSASTVIAALDRAGAAH